MAKIREILGHVVVEVAARERICHRNRAEHSIPKGEPCLVVHGGSRGAAKNYCWVCARPIMDRAQEDLRRINNELFGQERSIEHEV